MFFCDIFVHDILLLLFSTYRLNMREKGRIALTIQISPVLQRTAVMIVRLVKLMAVVEIIVDQCLLSHLFS